MAAFTTGSRLIVSQLLNIKEEMSRCANTNTFSIMARAFRETPDNVYNLAPNHIFVFGSNLLGRHGNGEAKKALRFGAKWGVGIGMKGKTYALPIRGLSLERLSLNTISEHVANFGAFAEKYDDLVFLVSEIGCGPDEYTPEEIAPLFAACATLPNVFLPARFWQSIFNNAESHG